MKRYQFKTKKQKHQQLILIPQNGLKCKTMKTRFYINVAEQIEEQETLGSNTFFHREQQHFVDLGLTGSVPAANYSFVLLANETDLFKKLAD